jgi:Domain of unknown function (DUF3576)
MRLLIALMTTSWLLLVSGCAWVENDLDKGLSYGQQPEQLTRKIDDNHPGRRPKGVNGFLWRASLDSIGFIPLTTSDPHQGLIVTDWYSAPSMPDERTKIRIEILSPQLRRDTIRVSIARQARVNGAWITAPPLPSTAQALEETIIVKAREMRALTPL